MVGFPDRHGDRRTRLAASSRAGNLALRRMEPQQALIERLRAASRWLRMKKPAYGFGVSSRTIARHVERLRLSGVPLDVRMGRAGGVSLVPTRDANRPELDPTEVAAFMSSLAALGPSASESSASARCKLAEALCPAPAVDDGRRR